LDGGLGADTMRGGAGNDIYVIDDVGDVVIENPGEGIDTVEASISYALTANVENLTLTGTAQINGTGNELDNVIIGNSGNNSLFGGDGNDTLRGGAGADTLDGGEGSDTASYAGSNAGVTINLTTPHASGGHAEGDVLINIENLIGSSHNDFLTGDGQANRIEGGAGDDTLDGGGGADTLVGGTGNDTYYINNTGVTITELANQGTDTVISSINHDLGANLENLTLTGNATIGTGNTLNNTITANNLGNTLNGDAGNDTLIGGTGNDTLNGDAGNDTLRATAGNNTLNGGADNDTLVAGTGNDTLNGGDGDDTLDLLTHNLSLEGDLAFGGAGDDTVIINQSQNTGSEIILDGETGRDSLQVWGTSGATLDLLKLNATNFEQLDLHSDPAATNVSLSSAGIMQLVNNTSGVDVLSLRMGSNDTYTIAVEDGITVTQGQNINFYNGGISENNLIAQVNFLYA
jgi:Ca2+-binding RTX toxin-like protein